MKNEEKPQKIENEEKGNLSLEKGAKIDINDLHKKLGHPAEEMVKLTGNYMKLLIQGKWTIAKIVLLGKCGRKTSKKDRKKNRQNQAFLFTLILHCQNSQVREDRNIGFWQWMKPYI